MKRRQFLKQASVGVAGGALAAPAIAQTQPQIRWRMASSFPEEPRHPVRHRRAARRARIEIDRRQVRDPRLRRGRNRAAAAGARCRAERNGRMRADGELLLRRQEPGARVRHGAAFRSQLPAAECVDVLRRRASAHARAFPAVQHRQFSVRQHRHADGRLVSQGDQDGRRSERPQDADRRARGADPRETGRRAAADRRRRHLSRARKRHDRRRGMGGTVRRREARLPQGREVLLLPRAGGKAPRSSRST